MVIRGSLFPIGLDLRSFDGINCSTNRILCGWADYYGPGAQLIILLLGSISNPKSCF